MWTDGMDLPPLVTTSPVGTPATNVDGVPQAGALTRTGTRVLFGGGDVLDDTFNGLRLRFGFWLDRCHTLGIGAEYMELDRETESFNASSTGTPILARPFFNTAFGFEDSQLIAFPDGPNASSGSISVNAYSELAGGSVYLRKLTCCDEGCREWLFCGCKGHFCSRSEFRFGYRYMELDEGVGIREEIIATDGTARFDISDNFTTKNQFNGVDFGWNHRITRGYWTWDGLVRVAVGNTRQTVTINGATTSVDTSDAANPVTENFDEGILALASNSGTHRNDEFSILPEINLTLGYQLTDHLKATVGYTGIYWSNVVRPGQHIPTMTNSDFFPPALATNTDARPLFAFDTTDYWAHGINYGLEYRW